MRQTVRAPDTGILQEKKLIIIFLVIHIANLGTSSTSRLLFNPRAAPWKSKRQYVWIVSDPQAMLNMRSRNGLFSFVQPD
ncbi:hypothetical protein IF1G_06144 [Cordyceps javanica]|uniref:Uncharacterized protein n=1 Tax=Cordyceps javanica TaxID=43265 RepID=A0A545V0D4_9HYPO|nr:hypothetical protein IF1G_06144 [Cordyceps javanica]